MKSLKTILGVALLSGALSTSAAWAADHNPAHNAQAKLKPYPLTTCVVSGEKLGQMGAPYVFKYKDREIKFCCKGCLKDFNKDPDKYIKILDQAEKGSK